MEYGYIKDTTIQAIADGIRDAGIVPKYKEVQIPFKFKTPNATSLDDPTPTEMHPYNGYRVAISTLPEAVSTEVHIKVGYLDNSVVTGLQGTIYFLQTNSSNGISPDCPYIDIYADSPREYTIKVPAAKFDILLRGLFNSNPDWLALNITAYGLDNSGFRIWSKTDEIIKMTTEEIVEAINNCPPFPPESAFNVTGNCQYKFASGSWDWFINFYGDKITTEDITNTSQMFQQSKLSVIPFDINLVSNTISTGGTFNQCSNLEMLPKITNLKFINEFCKECGRLKSLNGLKLLAYATNNKPVINVESSFSGCYKLRDIGHLFDNIPDFIPGNSIFGFYNTFKGCYTIDELVNLPYIYSTYNSPSYGFSQCFIWCCRIKDITFRNQVADTTIKDLKPTLLDLSSYVGYGGQASWFTVEGGLDASKLVEDDASYQALKNDPDWFTDDYEYSRYNHDSAVNTINSLPDVSALNVTNTIKFKGASGSKTDGGAIENLTAEEIAVAAAKGWTVSLV
jgi:hypothetical protein